MSKKVEIIKTDLKTARFTGVEAARAVQTFEVEPEKARLFFSENPEDMDESEVIIIRALAQSAGATVYQADPQEIPLGARGWYPESFYRGLEVVDHVHPGFTRHHKIYEHGEPVSDLAITAPNHWLLEEKF